MRDRLFDLLMRRIDTLQTHRAGVLALLRALPADPPTALLLALATRRSMRWMLEAAGIPTRGIQRRTAGEGPGRRSGSGRCAPGAPTTSEDLAATMAALDAALRRAEQAAGWLGWRPRRGGTAGGGRRTGAAAARGAGLSVVAPPPIKGAQQEGR